MQLFPYVLVFGLLATAKQVRGGIGYSLGNGLSFSVCYFFCTWPCNLRGRLKWL